MVHDLAGVTRDRLELEDLWWIDGKGLPVTLVDTGGLGGDRFADEIEKQVKLALNEADVILFLFDSQSGLTPLDEDLLRGLQRSGAADRTPIIGVVNKVDAEVHEDRISDFYTFGLDPVLTISAEHGRGIDDLKKAILESAKELPPLQELPSEEEEEEKTEERVTAPPRIAIVGRPNVGKSTLLNAILQEDRMITSPIAGTTSDSVDTLATLNGKPFLFVDTAGIRRKSKTEQGIEVLSVVQTRKVLEQADLALLVLDGEAGTSDQDEKIGGLIEEVGCSVVLIMNKWDTQRNNPNFTRDAAATRIRAKMRFLKYAPIVFTSALQGKGIEGLGDLLEEILHQRQLKLPTHDFTEWVRKEITIHNPMNAKFFLCHQSGRHPPTFVCHVSDPEKVHFSLRRHLVNALRERWGYMGTPIRMLFVEGKNRRSLPKLLDKDKPKPAFKKTPFKKAAKGSSTSSGKSSGKRSEKPHGKASSKISR